MVGLSLLPFWLSTLNDGNVKRIAVIDHTGMYAPLLKSTDIYQFEIVGEQEKSSSESKLGSELFGILQISDDLNKNPGAVSITSEKQSPQDLQELIRQTLREKVTQQRLDELSQQASVNSEAIVQVREILENSPTVTLQTLRMGGDGSVKESSSEVAAIIGMIFTVLIYMFILMYGNMVMQAVLEEKKTRIVEVMVSSVKPVKLLIGKIVGIGLVGITQLAIWTILAGGLFALLSFFIASPEQVSSMSTGMGGMNGMGNMGGEELSKIMDSILSVNWLEIIVLFLLFFIGGYVLYASIFAMFASAVDSEEDTSQFLAPVTLLIMFAFFAGFYSASNPDGPLAFWASLIPFSSPIVMMVRIPFGIPLWEKILSLVLLYGTFILISILAAKIYRVGILMYGKKPSLKEMFKWVRYK